MANVQILKLASGEDVIGLIDEMVVDGRAVITVEKGCLLLMRPKENSPYEFSIGMAPFAPYAKGLKLPIFPAHIVSIYEPETGLLNEYNKRFGSGLIVPDTESKIILNG
jgi:hypothetical protein